MAGGNNPIKYSDMFDVSDDRVINEIIKNIDKIDKRYSKLIESTQNLANAQQNSLQRSAKELIEAINKLSASSKESQKAITDMAGAVSDLSKRQQEVIKTEKLVENARKSQKATANELVAQIRKLTTEYTNLSIAENKDEQAMKALKAQIIDLKKQQKAITDDLKVSTKVIETVTGSYNALEAQVKANIARLKQMPDALKPVTTETKQLIADIRAGNQQLKDFDKQIGVYNRNVGNYADGFKSVSGAVLGFSSPMGGALLAITAVTQATAEAIKKNLDYSDSLADIQRTAGLTANEADALVESLKKIDTRTSLKGLLDLSIIGGSLGVAKEELAGFTKAIDQLAVVLDKEIEGGAEGIAKSLGTLNNVFKVQQKEAINTEEALLKTGSAVLKLGQEGLATGGFLTDFAERVGGVASQANISLPSVLAYGATLQEAGISAEVAGTSFSALITQLARAPKEFFKIASLADANLSLKEFTRLIDTDTKKAFDLFLQGLSKNRGSLTGFANSLKDLGVDGGRTISVLATLSRELENTAGKTDIATKAFGDGTLASEQFRLKNEDLAGAVARLGKVLSESFANSEASRGIASLINSLLDGTFKSRELEQSFNDQQASLKPLLKTYDELKAKADKVGGSNKLTKDEQNKLNQTIQDIARILPDAIKGIDEYGNVIDIARSKVDELVSSLANGLKQAFEKDASDIRSSNKELKGLIESRRKIIQGTSGFFDELFTVSKDKAKSDLEQSIQTYRNNILKLRDVLKVTITKEEEAFLAQTEPKVSAKVQQKVKPEAGTGGTGGTGVDTKATKRAQTAIEQLKDKISKLSLEIENQALKGKVAYSTLYVYADAVKRLNDAEQEATLMMARATDSYKSLQQEAGILQARLEEQIKSGEKTTATTERLTVVNEELKRVQDGVKLAIAETVGGLELLNTKLELSRQAFEKESAEGQISANTLNSFLDATKAVEDAQLRMQRAILQATDPLGLLNFEIDQLKKAMEAQVMGGGIAIQTIENYTKAVQKLNVVQQKLRDAQNPFVSQDVAVQQAQQALNLITPGARRQFDQKGGGDKVTKAREAEAKVLQAQLDRLNAEQAGLDKSLLRYQEIETEKTRITAEQEEARTRIAKEKQETRNRYAEEGANFLTTLLSGLSDIRKANDEAEIQRLEAQKEKELSIVGNNADARNAIEKKYAKQQAEIKKKQAEADRRNALFEIAIQTAIGVAKAVASSPLTFGLPWSAFVLAQGALQAALVAAKPIQQYYKGTKNATEGLAIVGERGVEAVESKDGSVRLTGSKAHLTYLKQGDKVHTAESQETKYWKSVLDGSTGGRVSDRAYTDSINSISDKKRAFEQVQNINTAKALASSLSPETITHAMKQAIRGEIVIERNIFDDNGYSRYRESQGLKIKDLNSRNRLR